MKIEKEQQGVFFNLEFIQNYFQETSKSLENILQKEREVKVARTTFQKAVALSTKEDFGKLKNYLFQSRLKVM
jgi:hypothetical protein